MERKLGSPPRRRGKAKERNVQLNLTRITPAWAGKSYGTDGKMPWLWDHPRVGGEKPTMLGSPQTCRGITPAWAGKRCDIKNIVRKARDHPRVGGEKSCCGYSGFRAWGSPPRGRGKGGFVIMTTTTLGITPAWAGKRLCLYITIRARGDHPRVGGEKLANYLLEPLDKGSPPRGRGKVHFCFGGPHCVGITPAWAGKSRRGDRH